MKMIFEAVQSKQFRFKFDSLGSKILKFPEFDLFMEIPDLFDSRSKTAHFHRPHTFNDLYF